MPTSPRSPWPAGVVLALLATPAAFPAPAHPQDGEGAPPPALLLRGERVLVRPGEVLEPGEVLVQEGVIVAVGRDLEVPDGTRELSGPLVCAGFTDPWSAFGLDAASRQDERTTAATRTADALDPYLDARLLRDLLRGGITSYRPQAGATAKVGGLGCVVRVRPGADLDESTLLDDACVAMSVGVTRSGGGVDVFDRLAEVDAVTSALEDARKYREDQVEYRHELEEWQKTIAEKESELEDDFKKAKKDREKDLAEAEEKGKEHREKRYKEDRKPKEPRHDPDKEVLARAVDGHLPLIVEVHRASEIRALLKGTERFDRLRLVLAGATEAEACAEELAERGVPVVLWPTLAPREVPDELDGADPGLAGRLHEAGVRVLLGSGGRAQLASRDLTLMAALAVGHGLDRDAALEALTVGPARVLDVADRIGTVERGKEADLLILDGDPLSTATRVLYATTAGEVVLTPEG